MAKHENLNVVIDCKKLKEVLNSKMVHLSERTDKQGTHQELTLFVKVRKNEKSFATHNVTIKDDGSWKELRDKDGNVVYLGTATPSKYQPTDDGLEVSQDTRQQSSTSPEDIF